MFSAFFLEICYWLFAAREISEPNYKGWEKVRHFAECLLYARWAVICGRVIFLQFSHLHNNPVSTQVHFTGEIEEISISFHLPNPLSLKSLYYLPCSFPFLLSSTASTPPSPGPVLEILKSWLETVLTHFSLFHSFSGQPGRQAF